MRHPRRALALHADGALPRSEAAALAAHVVACAGCRALLAELERGVAAARLLDEVPLPAHRASGIGRSLADAPIGRERPRRDPSAPIDERPRSAMRMSRSTKRLAVMASRY